MFLVIFKLLRQSCMSSLLNVSSFAVFLKSFWIYMFITIQPTETFSTCNKYDKVEKILKQVKNGLNRFFFDVCYIDVLSLNALCR